MSFKIQLLRFMNMFNVGVRDLMRTLELRVQDFGLGLCVQRWLESGQHNRRSLRPKPPNPRTLIP